MKRTLTILALVASLAAFALAAASVPSKAADDPKPGTVQEVCPVMGYKVNKNLFVDYKGKRIYFCCATCPDEFKKDPDKYMKKLEEQGVILEDAPAK